MLHTRARRAPRAPKIGGKATGVTRAAVVCTIDIPFSVTTYDKIYRLLDVGKFQVVNPRVPEATRP